MSKSSALVVIDVQRDVVADALEIEKVVGNINSLIEKARTDGTPIIWVQHSDDYLVKESAEWEFVPELVPGASDVRIYKTHPSSFQETDLSEHLQTLGTRHLVITGAQTDHCVNATSNAAVELGFDVTLVGDAHTTGDTQSMSAAQLIAEKNQQFASLTRANQVIAVLPTAEVSF